MGLATHFVPARSVAALLDDAGTDGTEATLARHAADPGGGRRAGARTAP
ncbi:hypothetical protein [Georgenia sp. SUBG003]